MARNRTHQPIHLVLGTSALSSNILGVVLDQCMSSLEEKKNCHFPSKSLLLGPSPLYTMSCDQSLKKGDGDSLCHALGPLTMTTRNPISFFWFLVALAHVWKTDRKAIHEQDNLELIALHLCS